MSRHARDNHVKAQRRPSRLPVRAPRAIESLAALFLHAEADDSRLGDLSEQYVRHHRRAYARLGGERWARALSHLFADACYIAAAANITLLARATGTGLPLAAPPEAKFAAPVPTEGTMALARSDAASPNRLKPVLLLTAAAFLVAGATHLWYTWRQTEALVVGVQQEKADAAAAQVEQIIGGVLEKVAWATDRAAGTVEQRRLDSLRLMRQVPPLAEIVHLDAEGRELLRVSRFARDTAGAGTDYAGDARYLEARKRRTYVGPVHFRNGSEPHVSLAIARDGGNAGAALAELNIRAVADAIRSVKSGETGYAYLVDSAGRIVAGPEANTDRPRLDPPQLPERDNGSVRTGLAGVPVLSAQAAVPAAGWRVVVELPVVEARQPLWNALLRGVGVLMLGLAAVALAIASGAVVRTRDARVANEA